MDVRRLWSRRELLSPFTFCQMTEYPRIRILSNYFVLISILCSLVGLGIAPYFVKAVETWSIGVVDRIKKMYLPPSLGLVN